MNIRGRGPTDGVRMVSLVCPIHMAYKILPSLSGMKRTTSSRRDSLACPTPKVITAKVSRKRIFI